MVRFTFLTLTCLLCLSAMSCGSNKIEIYAEKDAAGNLMSEIVVPESDITPALNVYIDNTGSMDGYMIDGSELKDAVYDYISSLNEFTVTTNLYYINNRIIPYKGNLEAYIKDLNPTSFKLAGGSRANTDFSAMIANVLETFNDSTVIVFISDCILDLPVKDTRNFLTNCQITIKNAVVNRKRQNPDLGIEILKLSSSYEGNYFYPNGSTEYLKDVTRPYYIWMFGNKQVLAGLNKKAPYTDLSKYGLDGAIAFTQESDVAYEIKNRTLTSTVITPANGDYKATIRADFGNTLQPEDIITDPANYYFNNPTVYVELIKPITDRNSRYTHFINIVIPASARIIDENLTFNSPELPYWVYETNDETGENIIDNIDKTTGIGNLIQGVADAYKNDIVSTNFNISIKRK